MLHLAQATVFIQRVERPSSWLCLLDDDTWYGSDISGCLRKAYLYLLHHINLKLLHGFLLCLSFSIKSLTRVLSYATYSNPILGARMPALFWLGMQTTW
jgi:hypothetical protein